MSGPGDLENAGDIEKLYQQVILRHSRNPAHARRPARVDAAAIGDNPMCGDHVELFVTREGAKLADLGFAGQGCAISLAAADMMADLLHGATEAQARATEALFRTMIATGARDPSIAALHPLCGVHDYPSRHRCALLPWQALITALDQATPA